MTHTGDAKTADAYEAGYRAGVDDEKARWEAIMDRLLKLLPAGAAALVGLLFVVGPAHAGFNRMTLDWTDNATSEVSTRIERKAEACAGAVVPFTEVATVAPNIITYVDTAVTVGQVYCYRVRAEGAGSLFSAFSNTAQGMPDGAPSNLTVR